MSLASVHVNKMSLGVINLKTGCCTKTWVSVALSTLVFALLSSSFLGTNFTFFLRSLLFSNGGISSGKCRPENHQKHLVPWGQLKMLQARQKYNPARISKVALFPLTFYTGCEHSINFPP